MKPTSITVSQSLLLYLPSGKRIYETGSTAVAIQYFFHRRQRRSQEREKRRRQFSLTMSLVNEFAEKISWLNSAQNMAEDKGFQPLFAPSSGVWIAAQGELISGGLPFDTLFYITKAQAALAWVMEGVTWLNRINDDPSWAWPAQQETFYEKFGGKRAMRMEMQLERIRQCLEAMEDARISLDDYVSGLGTENDKKSILVALERMSSKRNE